MDRKMSRNSILKKESKFVEDTSVDVTAKLKRRISFSGRKSIRVFSGEEETQAWNNSFEVSDHAVNASADTEQNGTLPKHIPMYPAMTKGVFALSVSKKCNQKARRQLLQVADTDIDKENIFACTNGTDNHSVIAFKNSSPNNQPKNASDQARSTLSKSKVGYATSLYSTMDFINDTNFVDTLHIENSVDVTLNQHELALRRLNFSIKDYEREILANAKREEDNESILENGQSIKSSNKTSIHMDVNSFPENNQKRKTVNNEESMQISLFGNIQSSNVDFAPKPPNSSDCDIDIASPGTEYNKSMEEPLNADKVSQASSLAIKMLVDDLEVTNKLNLNHELINRSRTILFQEKEPLSQLDISDADTIDHPKSVSKPDYTIFFNADESFSTLETTTANTNAIEAVPKETVGDPKTETYQKLAPQDDKINNIFDEASNQNELELTSDKLSISVLDMSSPLLSPQYFAGRKKKLNFRQLNEQLEKRNLKIFPETPSKKIKNKSQNGSNQQNKLIFADKAESTPLSKLILYPKKVVDEVNKLPREIYKSETLTMNGSIIKEDKPFFSGADDMQLNDTLFLTQATLGDETKQHNKSKCSKKTVYDDIDVLMEQTLHVELHAANNEMMEICSVGECDGLAEQNYLQSTAELKKHLEENMNGFELVSSSENLTEIGSISCKDNENLKCFTKSNGDPDDKHTKIVEDDKLANKSIETANCKSRTNLIEQNKIIEESTIVVQNYLPQTLLRSDIFDDTKKEYARQPFCDNNDAEKKIFSDKNAMVKNTTSLRHTLCLNEYCDIDIEQILSSVKDEHLQKESVTILSDPIHANSRKGSKDMNVQEEAIANEKCVQGTPQVRQTLYFTKGNEMDFDDTLLCNGFDNKFSSNASVKNFKDACVLEDFLALQLKQVRAETMKGAKRKTNLYHVKIDVDSNVSPEHNNSAQKERRFFDGTPHRSVIEFENLEIEAEQNSGNEDDMKKNIRINDHNQDEALKRRHTQYEPVDINVSQSGLRESKKEAGRKTTFHQANIDIDSIASPVANKSEKNERIQRFFVGTPHRSVIEFENLEMEAEHSYENVNDMTKSTRTYDHNQDEAMKRRRTQYQPVEMNVVRTPETKKETFKLDVQRKIVFSSQEESEKPCIEVKKCYKNRNTIYESADILEASGLKSIFVDDEQDDPKLEDTPGINIAGYEKFSKRTTENLTPNQPLPKKRFTQRFSNCNVEETFVGPPLEHNDIDIDNKSKETLIIMDEEPTGAHAQKQPTKILVDCNLEESHLQISFHDSNVKLGTLEISDLSICPETLNDPKELSGMDLSLTINHGTDCVLQESDPSTMRQNVNKFNIKTTNEKNRETHLFNESLESAPNQTLAKKRYTQHFTNCDVDETFINERNKDTSKQMSEVFQEDIKVQTFNDCNKKKSLFGNSKIQNVSKSNSGTTNIKIHGNTSLHENLVEVANQTLTKKRYTQHFANYDVEESFVRDSHDNNEMALKKICEESTISSIRQSVNKANCGTSTHQNRVTSLSHGNMEEVATQLQVNKRHTQCFKNCDVGESYVCDISAHNNVTLNRMGLESIKQQADQHPFEILIDSDLEESVSPMTISQSVNSRTTTKNNTGEHKGIGNNILAISLSNVDENIADNISKTSPHGSRIPIHIGSVRKSNSIISRFHSPQKANECFLNDSLQEIAVIRQAAADCRNSIVPLNLENYVPGKKNHSQCVEIFGDKFSQSQSVPKFEEEPITISDVSRFYISQWQRNESESQNERPEAIEDNTILKVKKNFVDLSLKRPSSDLDNIDETRLTLVESILMCPEDEPEDDVLPVEENIDVLKNHASETTLVCRKCKQCQETINNETISSAAESFMLPERPSTPDIGMDNLMRLRSKPTIEEVYEYWRRRSIDLPLSVTDYNYDNDYISDNEDGENEAVVLIAEFKAKMKRIEIEIAKTILPKTFIERLESRLSLHLSNWIFDYQMQAGGIYQFDHRRITTFSIITPFIQKDSFGNAIEIKSVNLQSSRAPRKNWKPFSYVLDFQLKLELPLDLFSLCHGSDDGSLFEMLKEVDKICVHVEQLGRSFWKLVCMAMGSLIREGNAIYVKKIVRNVVEFDGCRRVAETVFKIQISNLHKICFKDISAPPLHLFREDIQYLPTGLEFIKAFLTDPMSHLKS